MRALRAIAMAIGTALLFLVAVVAGVLLHLNTPRGRRIAATEVNAILEPSFRGRITVDRIGGLSIFGLSGTDARIVDPEGRQVVAVTGVRARLATFDLLRSAVLSQKGPLRIHLSTLSVESLDLGLDANADGQLRLLDAVSSRTPSPPPDPNARGTLFEIAALSLHQAHVHGRPPGAPVIDAELGSLEGGFRLAPEATEVDVAHLGVVVHGIVNGADVVGALQGHVNAPSDAAKKPELRATWNGTLGEVTESIQASLVQDRVDLIADVPPADPPAIRSLWPESTITEPSMAHVEAHGKLEDIAVDVKARLGAASLSIVGHVAAGDDKSARLDIAAREIDPHQLVASAPASRLGLNGHLTADQNKDGALKAETTLAFLGGTVSGQEVPPATIHATAARDARGILAASAEISASEPGTTVRADAHVASVGSGYTVSFQVDANVSDFDKIPQLGHGTQGRASVLASGWLDTTRRALEAQLHVDATSFAYANSRVQGLLLEARAFGGMDAPTVDASLCSRGVYVQGRRFTSVNAAVHGPLPEPRVTVSVRSPDTPDVDAGVDLKWQGQMALGEVRIAARRASESALLTVQRISLTDGGVRVDDLRLQGAGSPLSADFESTRGEIRVRASTPGLDVGRLGRLANLEKQLVGGTIAFDADLRLSRFGGRGQITMDTHGVTAGGARELEAHLQASLEGRQVKGVLRAGARDIGTLNVDAQKVVVGGGTMLGASSWKQTWGSIDLDGRMDLARVLALLPPGTLPIGEAAGQLELRAHIARDDADDVIPAVTLHLRTDHLVLAPPTPVERDIDGVLVHPLPAWRLAGVDFDVDAAVDGDNANVGLSTGARDVHGALAHVDLQARRFPFPDVLGDSSRLMGHLRSTPVEAHISIPERALGTLPPMLAQEYVTGRIKGDVNFRGTLDAPVLDVSATLRHAVQSGGVPTIPVLYDLVAKYDGKHATASVKAHDSHREMLDLEAKVDAALAAVLDGSAGAQPPWTASARAHFTSFPMGSIGELDDKVVSGNVSGDVTLTDLHKDGHLQAALTLDSLIVGSVGYKGATVNLTADGRTLDAAVHVDQTDGFFDSKAHAPAKWGTAMAPVLENMPLDASVSSRNFRVAALLPFVDTVFDELDGRLDSDARIKLDPRSRAVQASGTLAFRRGTIEVAAGGGELHDVSADVKLAPDGTISLEKLTASGMTGSLSATGAARLSGTSLQSAHATVLIPTGSAIPVTAGGVEVGSVDGRIDATVGTSEEGHKMALKISVPKIDVKLPEGSSTDAQSLGPMAKVRIGAHRGDPARFVLLPLDTADKPLAPPGDPATTQQLTLETSLADAHIVRGTGLKVDLTGHVTVLPGTPSRVRGQITLRRGGSLDVQGRTFTVDGGTVTFVGDDPSNPEVVVKASWTAPDATVVTATFTGPLKTGKVTLSSEPTLPNAEIVQLLLFGSPDGNQSQTPTSSSQNSAIATAGGEAAQPLNHMLNQLGLGAVTAKIDTSESANPKPEVEVQIAKEISVQLAVVLGQPPPGVNPDSTLLTVDWRFLSKWSLATTVGNAGTTIFDLLWQRRY